MVVFCRFRCGCLSFLGSVRRTLISLKRPVIFSGDLASVYRASTLAYGGYFSIVRLAFGSDGVTSWLGNVGFCLGYNGLNMCLLLRDPISGSFPVD
ncbi:hypothetical protein F2Q69_00046149 [Brassica cretica]|uniref:Uncharacterized protein n=1 Tax=Brassica cretica TaxID=69181 RepID=A0A8S9PYE9_BRACR|nr:hypothetical protein F2Q69_00046149 [Brassica cretica]